MRDRQTSKVIDVFELQREFFEAGRTRNIDERRRILKILRHVVDLHQEDLLSALHQDMHKPRIESWAGEIALVLEEIDHALAHLHTWTQRESVRSAWYHFRAKSWVETTPLGPVLIVGPWNYPVNLLLIPLVGALAAGNTCVIKPSEFAPQTSAVIAQMIRENFDPAWVRCIEGDAEVARQLIELPFKHCFFTGGTEVGRKVYLAAAKNLTPVTLELGGKTPCILADDASVRSATQRIVWAKYYNAGQTCVAPDYLLVPNSKMEQVVGDLKYWIDTFYSQDPASSESFGRIVNDRHWNRLQDLLVHTQGRIVQGPATDAAAKFIPPTLVVLQSADDILMKEEIFGPILPILGYSDLEDVYRLQSRHPDPLALYVFSNSEKLQSQILARIPSGGACINDALIHLGSAELPFGGRGTSGIGRYHGKASFDCFTHYRSVMSRPLGWDPNLRYPPYSKTKEFFIRLAIKFSSR